MAKYKFYIAGPMTGIKDYNKPEFDAAERKLLSEGHTVFNPAATEISLRVQGGDSAETGRDCLAFDLEWICRHAEAVYFLKGWHGSPGAMAEFYTAKACGLRMVFQ